MKAALPTYNDILPPGAANTGGSQRAARRQNARSLVRTQTSGGAEPARLCYAVTSRQNAQVCTRP
jgi:hypothetical protein